MNNKKLLLSKMLIVGTFILGGCNLFPEPASLIQAPQQTLATGKDSTPLFQLVKGFIPTASSLTVPNEPVVSGSVLQADFNSDGIDEAVAFYKSNIAANKVGAVVLQEVNKGWKPIETFEGNGYEISWGSATDIDGDEIPELLIGWKIGVSAGSVLDIFKWQGNQFVKLTQLNYHELELIEAQGQYRLALWNRDFEDVYNVDVLKWEEETFVSDKDLYPSYFLKVAEYYKQRTEAVPDAPYYWYYLADSLTKANQQEFALHALNKGMSLNIVVPSFEQFEKLQKEIQSQIDSYGDRDIEYYVPYADFTMNIPRHLASSIVVEGQEGSANEYIVNVNVTDQEKKEFLFSIEVHSKDFIMKEEITLPIIHETEHLLYVVRMGNENPKLAESSSLLYETYSQASALRNEMIASIRLGASFTKHINTEDELLIKKISDAYKQVVHVSMGGEIESETLETFTYQDKDYRYLGQDINSQQKLVSFLTSSYTTDAVQTFIELAEIIENNGRLAQPNADGGSLLHYQKASVLQVRDYGTEKQYDLKVPLGNSLSFEVVHIVIRKTEEGWRISSNPLSL
ncbi:DL-endopeptidase inhibitor IseA family protein [Fredinandcohnia humi]